MGFVDENGCHHDDKIGQKHWLRAFLLFVYQFKSSNHLVQHSNQDHIGHRRNMRGLGRIMIVFRLFEKLRYPNKTLTKFEGLNQE